MPSSARRPLSRRKRPDPRAARLAGRCFFPAAGGNYPTEERKTQSRGKFFPPFRAKSPKEGVSQSRTNECVFIRDNRGQSA